MSEQTPPAGGTPTPNPDPQGKENGGNGDGKGTNPNPTPKTFTEDEHQAELNRIAAKTREEEKAKYEKAVLDATRKATEEAERRAKLSEEERAKELQAEKEKEINAAKRDITIRENAIEARDKLEELGVSTKFAKFFVSEDKDSMMTNITEFHALYMADVKAGVEKATAGGKTPPTDPNKGGNSDGKREIITRI